MFRVCVDRGHRFRHPYVLAGLSVLVACVAASAWRPISARADFAGSETLTFENYGEGTPITTQYEPEGIIFSGALPTEPPIIAWDEASSTNPVLSGQPLFRGPIHGEFVTPGTPLPTTVNGLSMDVGFIDDPGSVRLTVDTTAGTETIVADEYGFNHLETQTQDITGFSVEEYEYDAEGFEIDNVSFTPGAALSPHPLPPAPPPTPTPSAPTPAPANPCAITHGSLAHDLLASLKCTAHELKLEAECGVHIFALVYLPLKSLDLIEAAKSADVIGKLPAKLRPAAKLLYDLYHAKYSKYAPRGFESGAQAVKTLWHLKTAADLIRKLPDIAKAVSKADFSQIALDIDEIAGLKSCVQAVADGTAG